jgi:uncharacterized membrane protein YphA (DoxX/SURF4 family)
MIFRSWVISQMSHIFLSRFMVDIVFITSGWSHVRDSERRSKDIGMNKGFTVFLGIAELAGSLGVIFGVLAGGGNIGPGKDLGLGAL